jgi:Stealth protein CR2, conserved region 2/Stealth protein CR1, conserved region 1/Stealth protein CR4, conserved region 4
MPFFLCPQFVGFSAFLIARSSLPTVRPPSAVQNMPNIKAHPGDHAPIDIVYLWVDGNDPAWRLKRACSAAAMDSTDRDRLAPHGNVEGRYRDNDELRYSLRALERFFPAHGHVYVVTDAQTPHWLRHTNRVTVIDHRDLIPAAQLPIFDSGHIESYVHRIPGLSERFFYFNDDVFFGAPVHVNDWFFDGGSYAAWSDEALVSDEPPHSNASAPDNACRLSKLWLDAAIHRFNTFAHAPRPLLKSALMALEAQAPELFAQARRTVFRAWGQPSLICDFALRWGMQNGVVRSRDYRYLYVSSGGADAAQQLGNLMASWGQVDFFCINDTTDDALAQDARLLSAREALQHMFPRPSSFELMGSEVCSTGTSDSPQQPESALAELV